MFWSHCWLRQSLTSTPKHMGPLSKIAMAASAAALVGFVGGAVTSAMRGWGSPAVEVVVENETTSVIRFVNLQLSSCGATSSLSAQDLAPGHAHTFRFFVCGEGGYTLDAMLENKMVLSSGEYVESGYRVVESVGPFRIRSDIKTRYF